MDKNTKDILEAVNFIKDNMATKDDVAELKGDISKLDDRLTAEQFSAAMCRVEMWRGGCRMKIAVAASFVWRCLTGSTMTPFPHPAHRTGHADFPHPALGQDFTPLLSRATPSAVSEHSRS